MNSVWERSSCSSSIIALCQGHPRNAFCLMATQTASVWRRTVRLHTTSTRRGWMALASNNSLNFALTSVPIWMNSSLLVVHCPPPLSFLSLLHFTQCPPLEGYYCMQFMSRTNHCDKNYTKGPTDCEKSCGPTMPNPIDYTECMLVCHAPEKKRVVLK